MADGAAAGAMQVEHDQGKMDRNAFHRALVQALSDPYTISGRATAKNLQQLEKAQQRDDESFVLDARYELGKRDDAYLQAPVLPLQTADDKERPLGMRLDPLFEKAHRKGLYTALLEELRGKMGEDAKRLSSTLRLAGWLLTMKEIYWFVNRAVESAEAKALVANFAEVYNDADGEVKIAKFVQACVAKDNLKAARDIVELIAVVCEDFEFDEGKKTSPLARLLGATDDAVKLAEEFSLCIKHGIHQIADSEKAWLEENLPDAAKELDDAKYKGVIPNDYEGVKAFKANPIRRNLDAAMEDIDGFPVEKAKSEEKKTLLGKLKTAKGKSPTPEFKYNLPKAKYVKVQKTTCERTSVKQAVKKAKSARLDGADGVNPVAFTSKGDAMWAAVDKTNDVALAVAKASCLELVIRAVGPDKGETDAVPLGQRLVAAHAKVKQLRALQTCIKAAEDGKFAGPGFNLPVLRCRAVKEGKDNIKYYKYVVRNDNGKGKLDKKKLDDAVDPKKFEDEVGLRDLSSICMPATVELKHLRAALHDGIDAAEDVLCNTDQQKTMEDELAKVEKAGDPGDKPDDPGDFVETTARKRRRDVWSDGLREAALANDKLYAFARQLGGAIGEPISEVAIIDDSKLAAESKQIRDARQRASQRAAEQHADLVKTVIGQVMKESQLTLGISDSGSSFAGMSSNGAVDLSKIKIVSGALRREASDLAGLGKGGETTDRFFGNAVKLESLLRSGTGEMTFSDLLAQLRVAGQQLQLATVGDVEMEGVADSSASIEYLSAPRNSLMLRWRAEALAAIREAYAVFKQEMRFAHRGVAIREIRAYELVEGRDGELTTLFATLCGLKLSANRLHSGSASMYTSHWAARNNNQQLALALARVTRRACTYAMNGGGMVGKRQDYHR